MTSGHFTHATSDGERWDQIAHRYYGDISRQTLLIARNRALFPDFAVPSVLPAGLTLVVPIIERDSAPSPDLLPPWKRP